MAVIVRAALGAVAIAAASFGLVSILPHPTASDRLAVRALSALEQKHGGGSLISLDGERLRASCRRLPHWRHLVTLSDGTRLVLSGSRARIVAARTRVLASDAPVADPAVVSAVADLAGSHGLYVRELIGRLAHGRKVVVGLGRVNGIPAYRLRLGGTGPHAVLLVSRRTFAPLAVRYVSRTLTGTSLLRAGGRNGC